MSDIKKQLRNKSPDYIEGFLNGVKLFAWWKDGVEYVGTCGKMYLEVLTDVNELLKERAEEEIATRKQ